MKYLKWADDTIGCISDDYSVEFIYPRYNNVLCAYTKGKSRWSRDEFVSFLSERAVGRDRRDIEKILFRCGLSRYDVIKISELTRSMHPKDLIWIAKSPEEKFRAVMTDVFESVFLLKTDLAGDSVDTPEGYNIKRYGCYNGKYGIYKQRISPLSTDAESEVAVYELGRLFGVPCCPAVKVDENTVFSEFMYDFANEYIVHFRRLFDGARSENEYENLICVRPQYKNEIVKMMVLDFITRQDDRHLSNIAVKMSACGEEFYPLYDNGRSLFYEDTPETAEKACRDVETFATTFGFCGTYLDHIREAVKSGVRIEELVNLNVSENDIKNILTDAGFKNYRFEYGVEWIMRAVDILGNISN